MPEIERTVATNVGYHLRGGVLIEQANATKTLANADMASFKQEGLLGDADIANLDAKIADVLKGLQDRTLVTGEAHLQTAEQSVAIHDVKSDRRRLTHCVERVFTARPELAQFRQGTYHGTNVPALCTDINRKLAFAKEHQADLAPVGASSDFLAQFEAKVRALEASSGAQEAAIASLPDNRRSFCESKGRLYFAIKDINNAGQALHSGDLEAAAKYNLKVLYRRGKGKAAADPPAPAPTK
jgi:hypothetical protein